MYSPWSLIVIRQISLQVKQSCYGELRLVNHRGVFLVGLECRPGSEGSVVGFCGVVHAVGDLSTLRDWVKKRLVSEYVRQNQNGTAAHGGGWEMLVGLAATML